MKPTVRKRRKSPRQIEREVRYFWGGVFLFGLLAVLLMYTALA